MRELIDTFLDEMLAQGKSPNTVRTYRSGLCQFAREIGKPLAEIASRDIHVWLMGIKNISPLEAAQRVHKARLHEATDKERTVNAIKVPDIAPIRAEIALAENHNAKVREYRAIVCALDDKRSRLKEKRSEAGKLTDELAAIEQAKVEAIAAADLPVKGLGFDESGVSYNGIPFPQLSSSEQLRVSMAVAMALNPKIKVLRITDGSLLDEASMDIIRQMAGDRGYQVWVEKVQETPDTKPAVVFVEDGEVVSDTTGLRLNGNGSAEKAA